MRGEHEGPFVGLTGAWKAVWRPGDGDEVAAVEKLSGGGAQARREGKRRRERCSEMRRGSPPFIGVRGAPRRWQWLVTDGLMALKP
jgi:hypothetical protein